MALERRAELAREKGNKEEKLIEKSAQFEDEIINVSSMLNIEPKLISE